MPRIVAGPVLVLIEGVSTLLARRRATRMLLASAMLMDLVPATVDAAPAVRSCHHRGASRDPPLAER